MSEAETVGANRISVRTLAARAGMGLSLALVFGAGVWGWRLMERETVGVPIVRAVEGPMRVAPTEPGGDRAEHQGLSVSSIAAGAGELPLASAVHLAPRTLDLAAEDMPALPEDETPVMDAIDLAVAEALGLDTAELIQAKAPVGSMPTSRPQRSGARVAVPGGDAVQLGAFPDEQDAADAWQTLRRRFPDLLEGMERRIERVDRDDRTFWRLRAGGFDDLADARRVCAALTAGDAECIPVVRH